MDDRALLERLTVPRLAKLAAGAGLSGTSRLRKRELVERIVDELDDALRHEALLLFTGAELAEIAAEVGVPVRRTRKRELVHLLRHHRAVAGDSEPPSALLLDDDELLMADRHRLDLPRGERAQPHVELLPGRPGAAEGTRFFEVQELLRRPNLSRAVLVAASCDDALLARLLGEGLDDLIESAVRWRPRRDARPLVSVVLDHEAHRLLDGDAGRALVTLARELRGRLEIRVGPRGHRLGAELLAFEEQRDHGPFMTAMVGAAQALEPSAARGAIEANVWIAGPLASLDAPVSLIAEWLEHLLRESRVVRDDELDKLPALAPVERKARYKAALDTAHELRLKHLAEHLVRRGRFSMPIHDPTVLRPPPPHQLGALVRAAEPGREAVLLLDEHGLGKTVETGMILARELRRRRVHASSESSERRRALIIAPTSRHEGWIEVLGGMFGLEVGLVDRGGPTESLARWRGRDAQVVVGGPTAAADHWEDLQGFELLVVDHAHLYEDEILSALAGVRQTAELCLVLSALPAQHDVADVIVLAHLAMPEQGWEGYQEIIDDPPALEVMDHLGHELRADATRAVREPFFADGRLVTRRVEDRLYDLEPDEMAAYHELRQMRTDYLRRGGETKASAFSALERAFLSSRRAFHAAACRLVGDREPRDDADLLPRVTGDRSFAFVRSSSYYQRRIRTVRDLLADQAHVDAPINAKEAALLDVLTQHRGRCAVVACGYRATQQRLSRVLSGAKLTPRIELLDDISSLGERLAVVRRFGRRTSGKAPAHERGPRGVLLVTDAGLRDLDLSPIAALLVNYDLPWNPQRIESRIRRLQRWGQSSEVTVINVAAKGPDGDAWTMDHRVLFACRELFGMAGAEDPPSDALIEIEPDDLEVSMAADASPEVSLIEEPDEEVVELVDALLAGEREEVAHGLVALAEEESIAYRDRLADFWSRVTYGHGDLRGARGYLHGRLGLALLQGMVGVLGVQDGASEGVFDLGVGVRLMVEAAPHVEGEAPIDDAWLIEDEVVHLWLVDADGALIDGSDELLDGGLVEIGVDEATPVVGRDVLAFLAEQKERAEREGRDALVLSAWHDAAPQSLAGRFEVVVEEARRIAELRLEEIEGSWEVSQRERVARLERRLALVRELGDDPDRVVEHALGRARRARVKLRHTVLGTQLFALIR